MPSGKNMPSLSHPLTHPLPLRVTGCDHLYLEGGYDPLYLEGLLEVKWEHSCRADRADAACWEGGNRAG